MTATHKQDLIPAAHSEARDKTKGEWTVSFDSEEIDAADERRIPTRKASADAGPPPSRPLAGVRRGPTRATTRNGGGGSPVSAESKQVRLLPGRRVPGTRYRLVRWLGEGGMGVVYEAEHEDIERRVALKILRFEASEDPQQAAQFREEARAASRIGSPNIVEIFDFGELPDGRLMFAMEMLAGHGLDGELDKCPMDQGRLVGILRQVCKGLSAAHQVGIVHRDVKPDNIILVRHQGRPDWVKVVDFGIATMHADAEAGAAGTPHYMAPEQVLGQPFDGRLDMYSLGCTAYELLVGKPPFLAPTVDEILQLQLEGSPVPPSQRCPEGSVHPALEAVILRCLEKDPALRYRDMLDLEAALCEAQIAAGLQTGWDDLPLPEVEEGRLERIRRDMPQLGLGKPRRRWLWPAIAGASTLAAAGLALALVMLQGPAQEDQDRVDKLATAARAAAGKAHWVYPPPDDRDETALIRTHELEAIEGSAAALADQTGAELRAEFSAGLVRIGDQYWDLDGGKPFARDYYLQALLFDPNNQHARERAGSLVYGLLGDFQERALKGDFTDEELRGAGLLRVLAGSDEELRMQALQDLADDESATSVAIASSAGRLLSSSRGGRKLKRRDAEEPAGARPDALGGAPSQPVPEASGDPGGGKTPAAPTTRRDVKQSQKLAKDARAALASGNRKEAESLYHQALAADNRNAAALIGLSDLEFDKGAHQRAADYAEKAVAAAPKNGTYHLKLGDAYYKLLRYTDARRSYERAQELGVREADERLAKLKSKLGQ